jgi:hypothetical protein
VFQDDGSGLLYKKMKTIKESNMTHLNLYRRRSILLGLIVFFSFTCFFSFQLNAGESNNEKGKNKITNSISRGDLKTYEKKSLFIFPILVKDGIDTGILNGQRKQFLANLLQHMFVTDFRRINFFDVKADDSIDTFLHDAQGYIRKHAKKITVRRMQPDGKFKEAMVTSEELLKTTGNSFALVPFIDSVERKVVEGKKSNSYVYNIYLHFDIYNTKTKEKLMTLKINNKKNVIGILSSYTGSLQLDHSNLDGLPDDEKKDEKSFRNTFAGLYTVLKKKMKEMPQFKITATLSRVNRSSFGFDMGHDTGVKIDHRYKTYVYKASGGRKMTGFGKIRKVKDVYSEAQTLIGRPQEGDQVEEDPKVGINLVGGYGTAPLLINIGDGDVVAGSHSCLLVGAEYELGPLVGMSEWYFAMNLRLGLPGAEEQYTLTYNSVSQLFFNLGVLKKIYFRRFALNLGGYIGFHSATIHESYSNTGGSSVGITLNAALEVMITPSISAYGGFNLDAYPNPGKITEDDVEYDFPENWEWKATGLSFNLGAKITF